MTPRWSLTGSTSRWTLVALPIAASLGWMTAAVGLASTAEVTAAGATQIVAQASVGLGSTCAVVTQSHLDADAAIGVGSAGGIVSQALLEGSAAVGLGSTGTSVSLGLITGSAGTGLGSSADFSNAAAGAGDPMLDESGAQILDEAGNPILDEHGAGGGGGAPISANRIVSGGPPGTNGAYVWNGTYWEGPAFMNRLVQAPALSQWELVYYNSDEDNVISFSVGTPLTDLPEQATWINGVTVTT